MQPYTYILEFIPNGKKYYGVKFAKDADPEKFWKEYFTSSGVVKELIEEYGADSFKASIHKTFDTPQAAIKYELEYLRKIENKDEWLNQNFGTGYDLKASLYKTKDHIEKIRKGNSKPKTGKALEACRKNGLLGAEARRGQKDSIEVRRKRAESLSKAIKGKERPNRKKIVIIDGIEYKGVKSVTDQFNITRQTVYNRIKSDDWNWHYAAVK